MQIQELESRVKKLEVELELLKSHMASNLLEAGSEKTGKKPISLRGILKGVDITEEDIEKAKKSLFKGVKA